jgi:hypothetical protein
MAKGKQNTDVVEEKVSLTPSLREYLRYLGRVDGLSVPQVIRTMIDNDIRQRKASDPDFKSYTRRSA